MKRCVSEQLCEPRLEIKDTAVEMLGAQHPTGQREFGQCFITPQAAEGLQTRAPLVTCLYRSVLLSTLALCERHLSLYAVTHTHTVAQQMTSQTAGFTVLTR